LILNVVLWVIGLVFLFDNLGFNVTAVLTGFGVGGIAIALAAQTILGHIFNYKLGVVYDTGTEKLERSIKVSLTNVI
jgi:hypothetical protein